MKQLITLFILFSITAGANAIPVHYYGEINGSGNYSGAVDINFGWIDAPFGINSWGEHVNLWGFNASVGDVFSFDITNNNFTTGFSLYFGEIDSSDLLIGLFNNSGDIGDANYLIGSSLWGSQQSLSDFSIAQSGFYTLIIGGKDFGGYDGYTYNINVSQVPEPVSLLLLISGLLGLCVLRIRKNATKGN
jgi:hypothetical protein